MCWNKESSLIAFITISIVSYKLFQRNLKNDRLLALFIATYGAIQLWEFLIWISIDLKLEWLNKIGSILCCLFLYLQPLALITGMHYDKSYTKYKKDYFYNMLFVASLTFVLFGIYNMISHLNKNKKKYNFTSYPDDLNGHLAWDFQDHYYHGMIISFLISIYVFKQNKFFWLAGILYYIIPAIYMYLTTKVSIHNKDKNTGGSYWCWYVAMFSFILYFLNPSLQN